MKYVEKISTPIGKISIIEEEKQIIRIYINKI